MSLSASEIAAVVREIELALRQGWIQKIFQPTPRALVLEIRAPGRTFALLLSADPETARLHLLSHKPLNPATPPSFCQFLRARIQGARIDGLEQVPGDRIVRLRLTAREGPCSLVAELTGKTADLLLLDAEDKILVALESGREKTGQSYHLPVARPQDANKQERTPTNTEPLEQPERDLPFPISASIERRDQGREEDLARDHLRLARLAEVRKGIKKAARRIDALRADFDKATRYKEYARYGELLKANLGLMTKGQDQVTVIDYFDPAMPELTIPLDPAKTPQGNMDDYFKKHRKYLAADREIKPRLDKAERELEALHTERAAVERDEWTPAQEARAKPIARPPSPTTRHSPRSGPFRRFTSADGLPIYVGRNARENDELTFKFAHSDDLWLHAHGTPGSHVVVRLEKGADPPHETIKDAATLALLYSDLKKSGKGEVIYTRKKWVRKAKGQPPGTVTVTQEKAIFVQLDRGRLDRLKESSG
ncbi:MAG: fibronectin-binding domain-containing protein [Nitrospira sp.]|nr:fibronectin-binding domain-containing protein [Nitrospira sp.]